MGAAEKVPWQELALTAAECGALWGISGDHFLATKACLPDFPQRISFRPATWVAGEVIEYRNANRGGRPARRRKSGNKSSGSADPGGR
jgi:hypothetical protein